MLCRFPHASRVSIDNFDDFEPVQTETIVIRHQSGSTFMRDADGRDPDRDEAGERLLRASGGRRQNI